MQQGETTGICFYYLCSFFKEIRQKKKYRVDLLIINWKSHVKILAVLNEKKFTRKSHLGHAPIHSIIITKIHEDALEITYTILKTYTVPWLM